MINDGEKTGTPIAFVVQNKDDNIIMNSSSGGFFSSLAKYVINRNGVVFGALFNEKHEVVHASGDSVKKINAFRGSKYVQSKIGDTYSEVKTLLKQNRMVCFSGTPCQIEGLKNFLRNPYDNLITADIACHGVPSPKVFRTYLEYHCRNTNDSPIKEIKFRDKHYGYLFSTMSVSFQNGQIYRAGREADSMTHFFFEGLCSRPSCHTCKFKTINRVSDFTMFDCWHAKKFAESFDINRGATMVFIHSGAGLKIFDQIKNELKAVECDYKIAAKYDGIMIENSAPAHIERTRFFVDLNSISPENLILKYFPPTIKRKIKILIKPIIYKSGLLHLYLRIKRFI
jgi:coenzyme F420-reducing hydrogenase beta subunit